MYFPCVLYGIPLTRREGSQDERVAVSTAVFKIMLILHPWVPATAFLYIPRHGVKHPIFSHLTFVGEGDFVEVSYSEARP